MIMKRIAVFSLLALLAGCSTISGWFGGGDKAEKPAKLADFTQAAAFHVRWHEDVGEMGDSVLKPALTQDAVYAANASGKIYKLQRADGSQVWRVDSGFAITGGVGSGDGLVLVGGEKGQVAAYGEDGKLRWKTTAPSEVLSPPQAADGVVVVRTADGHVVGLSETDGKREWLYEHQTPSLIVRNYAGVTIANGVAYAGFAAGKLAAIDIQSGNVKWEATVSQPRGTTELDRISDITSPPVVDDGQVCAVSFQGRVGCFDAAQGNELWNRKLSSEMGLAISGRNLYVSDADGVVHAMDKTSGTTVWKNDQLLRRQTSRPLALDSFVIVGDFEGYLHALSSDDGRMMARIDTDGSSIPSAPQEMDDGLLVETRDGGLYSISIQ